jgi:hypothetical protein
LTKSLEKLNSKIKECDRVKRRFRLPFKIVKAK